MKPLLLTFLGLILAIGTHAQTDPDFFKYKKQADDCFAKKDYPCAEKWYKAALVVKANDIDCIKKLGIVESELSKEKLLPSFNDLDGSNKSKRLAFEGFIAKNAGQIVKLRLKIVKNKYEVRGYRGNCTPFFYTNIDSNGGTIWVNFAKKDKPGPHSVEANCWETGIVGWYDKVKSEFKGKFLISKNEYIDRFNEKITEYTLIPQ